LSGQVGVTATRTITDRYLVGTRLRLRRTDWPDGGCELKLTQKVPVAQPGAVQGLITNTYLSPAEYDLLARLPATLLSKTRFSVPPLGVDVFDAHLQGWSSQRPSSPPTRKHSASCLMRIAWQR
jgi:hypothetical protein